MYVVQHDCQKIHSILKFNLFESHLTARTLISNESAEIFRRRFSFQLYCGCFKASRECSEGREESKNMAAFHYARAIS